MAALTGFRPTEVYGGAPEGVLPTRYYVPVAANVTIYGGALVVIDASGNANPGGVAQGSCLGVADAGPSGGGVSSVSGTATAGTNFIQVRNGCFLWDFSATNGGAYTKANFGQKVYVVDDHTVQLTNGGSNTTAAGISMGLNPSPTSLDPTQIQVAVLTIGVGAFGVIT